jgi:hypothetical protein
MTTFQVKRNVTYAVSGAVLVDLMTRAGARQVSPGVFAVDPSNVGGACRARCHAAPNPAACCRSKAGVCPDADCKDGAFTGTPRPSPRPPPRPLPRPADCKAWNQCATTYAPAECCRVKPRACYDPNCVAGQFVMPTFTPQYDGTFADGTAAAATVTQADTQLFEVDPGLFGPIL